MRRDSLWQALACLVVLCALPAAAAQPVLARAMLLQPPVWVERGSQREPLRAGAAIYPGDRFETGAGGRLQLELEDSSTVKLGEQAGFELPALQVVDDGSEGGLLKGSLKLLRGALRYTTGALSGLRRREFDVYVGPTITSGIRGTDVFAKSESTQDLLCLLEGQVQVSSPGFEAQTMDRPNTFYVVPRGQPPKPISPTPPAKLQTWLPSTEMNPAAPALEAGGRHRLVLLSFTTAAQAQGEAARLAALGYPVEVLVSETSSGTRHRIVLPGFASKPAAQRYAAVVKKRLGIAGSWVLLPD